MAWLSEGVAQVLWTGLEVVAVVMVARLAVRASVRPSWCPPGVWLPVVVTVLAVSAPVASTIHFGQVSLFVTLAAAATLVGKRSGVWAGLASAVKLTPLALLPPIAGRRWRDGAVTVGAFVGAGALAWIIVPHESVQYWFHELPGGRYGHESLVGNQSLAGLLARNPLPGPPTLTTLISVTAMVAILVGGSWRAVRLARRGAGLSAFVVASCTGLLLAPVSWTHHQTPVLLAALCASLSTGRATTVLRGLIVVVMCVNLSAVHLPIIGAVLGESRLLLIAYLALLGRYQPLRPSTQRSAVRYDKVGLPAARVVPTQLLHVAPILLRGDHNQKKDCGLSSHLKSHTTAAHAQVIRSCRCTHRVLISISASPMWMLVRVPLRRWCAARLQGPADQLVDDRSQTAMP